MNGTEWRVLWPELSDFLDNTVYYQVDGYGMTYLNAMDQSWEEYGVEGISMQLLYIANNIKAGNKTIEKSLIAWSKKVK